jgi:hypothetical protein
MYDAVRSPVLGARPMSAISVDSTTGIAKESADLDATQGPHHASTRMHHTPLIATIAAAFVLALGFGFVAARLRVPPLAVIFSPESYLAASDLDS